MTINLLKIEPSWAGRRPPFRSDARGTADRQNRARGFERAIDPEAGAPCKCASMSCSGGLCPGGPARERPRKEPSRSDRERESAGTRYNLLVPGEPMCSARSKPDALICPGWHTNSFADFAADDARPHTGDLRSASQDIIRFGRLEASSAAASPAPCAGNSPTAQAGKRGVPDPPLAPLDGENPWPFRS